MRSETKYFPISDHPPLAWSSNEKAVDIYLIFRGTFGPCLIPLSNFSLS